MTREPLLAHQRAPPPSWLQMHDVERDAGTRPGPSAAPGRAALDLVAYKPIDEICHPQMAALESLDFEVVENVVFKADQAAK